MPPCGFPLVLVIQKGKTRLAGIGVSRHGDAVLRSGIDDRWFCADDMFC